LYTGVGVSVIVDVGVSVGVRVLVGVGVSVDVQVAVNVEVAVGVGVRVGGAIIEQPLPIARNKQDPINSMCRRDFPGKIEDSIMAYPFPHY